MKHINAVIGLINHFQTFFVDRIAPPSVRKKDSLILWRANVLFTIIFTALVFGTVALVAALSLAFKENAWGLAVFDILGYSLCIYILFSRRPSYKVRAIITLLMFYLVGLVVLMSVGPLSGGPIWLFTFGVLMGVLLGLRAALLAVALNGVTLVFIFQLITSGRFGQDFPFFETTQAMAAAGVNFIVLNIITAMSVSVLVKGFVSSHQKEKELTGNLEQEQAALLEVKNNLELEIEERKQAETALRESEKRFRELAELLPETVFEVNTEGKITFINQAAYKVFGYSLQDFERGLNAIDMIAPEFQEIAQEKIMARLSGQEFGGMEYRARRKDGTTFPVMVYSSPRIREDQTTGLRGLIIDITDRKKDQEENVRLMAQLQQSQKMEAVGTLAGGIAHDFNNILQAISGFVQLMSDRRDQDPVNAKHLARIDSAAGRASELVRQLLTFSRKLEPRLNPIDLNKQVLQAVNMLERTIPKMIDIELCLSDTLGPVNGDSTQLEQVLLNLGANARDAMPDGGRLLFETQNTDLDEEYCRRHIETQPGRYVRLTISDTGQGMDKETVKNMFDPFYTTKDIGKGAGLGLAMVYGILKNHKGHISCESRLGRGTTFEIFLPRLENQAPAAEKDNDEKIEVRGGEETILIVDDEPAILDVATDFLTGYGYKTITAASGEEAIRVHSERGPAIGLTIMDLGMPGMGGRKAISKLLKLYPLARIIVASGYSSDEETKDVLAGGAKKFISKPYRLKDMLVKVREVLDR